MKTILGPFYRYQGERLDKPEVILVQDHHYDPDHGYALQELLDNSLCPSDQHLLVFDHVLRQDEFGGYKHVCLPLLMAAETAEFNGENITPNWNTRTHAINFMINKPRPNRLLLMDLLIEHGLTNFCHSLCWADGYRTIPATNFKFGDEVIMSQGLRGGSHLNASTYNHLLKRQVFEPTCVSLITEPAFYERETILTEKTLMAIWAGTLPVWVGGWRCADTMRDMGFDIFDDVIDHSYQSLQDPGDRCRQAIELNLSLLQKPFDISYLHARFSRNLDLLRTNIFLRKIKDLQKSHPELRDIVSQYRNGLLAAD